MDKAQVDVRTVVPRAGTWIETIKVERIDKGIERRSPCGNVD